MSGLLNLSSSNNVTPTSAAMTLLSEEEASAASPADPDIPRLVVVDSSDEIPEYAAAAPSPMHIVIEQREYIEEADEENGSCYSETGNEQDDEDEDEDNNATDRGEDFTDDRRNVTKASLTEGRIVEDDIEASFIKSTKPKCSKTTLVSCLSSRSTSPGPISPLLSEDEYYYSSATTPPLISARSSSTASSRRSSNEPHSPRVRFKRGCVITEVNLTWAPTSYDRAPIDVAESLDMKRCQTIEDCLDAANADTEEATEFLPEHCDEGLALYHTSRQDSSEEEQEDEEQSEYYISSRQGDSTASRGRWLCVSEVENSDSYFTGHDALLPTSSRQMAAPPSPPMPSSTSTSAHANFAYTAATSAGLLNSQNNGDTLSAIKGDTSANGGGEVLESFSVPSLSPDESSMGSGSEESDDCQWESHRSSRSSSPPISKSITSVGHPSSYSSAAATAESSLGLAAQELCDQQRREQEQDDRIRGRTLISTSSGRYPSYSFDNNNNSLESASFPSHYNSNRSTSSSSSISSASSAGTTHQQKSTGSSSWNHELSPPPSEEQPRRKSARFNGMCAMGKFSRDEVFDACDALGGF